MANTSLLPSLFVPVAHHAYSFWSSAHLWSHTLEAYDISLWSSVVCLQSSALNSFDCLIPESCDVFYACCEIRKYYHLPIGVNRLWLLAWWTLGQNHLTFLTILLQHNLCQSSPKSMTTSLTSGSPIDCQSNCISVVCTFSIFLTLPPYRSHAYQSATTHCQLITHRLTLP